LPGISFFVAATTTTTTAPLLSGLWTFTVHAKLRAVIDCYSLLSERQEAAAAAAPTTTSTKAAKNNNQVPTKLAS